MRRWAAAALLAVIGVLPAAAQNGQRVLEILDANVSAQATGALGMLGVTFVPSETASTLAYDLGEGQAFVAAQLGGMFTVSDAFPLYLEGFLGYTRYDPTFTFTDGQQQSRLPFKWTSLGATGGVGWDFALNDEWTFRPIANVSLGHVESDIALAGRIVNRRFGTDLDFLDNGRLTAGGVGGSLMLAFERKREEYEADMQLRWTQIHIEPIASSRGIQASSDAATLGFWSRLRTPTPFRLISGPVRVVSELSASWLPGDQGEVLNEDWLGQVGIGLEVDSTDSFVPLVSRTRMVLRYTVGEELKGLSLGLAASF